MFRDRMNARIEENRKEMEILKRGKSQEEEARKKKEAAAYDMALRNLRFIDQHLKLKENNYRKMHGFPLRLEEWKEKVIFKRLCTGDKQGGRRTKEAKSKECKEGKIK